MGNQKPFQGDAAFLNGTAVGTLMLEIGRIKISDTSQDPEEVFSARVAAYVAMLQMEVTRLQEEEILEQNPRPLRTLGWLKRFLCMQKETWRAELQNFLRGMVRYGNDHSESGMNRVANTT